MLASASAGSSVIHQWDVGTGRRLSPPAGHQERLGAVACSPDGKWFAAGSDDTTAFLVNAAEGKQVQAFKLTFGACFAVAFSRDSERAVAPRTHRRLQAGRRSL